MASSARPRAAFQVTTLRSLAELRSLEPEWLALLARTKANMPFEWPQWCGAWWNFLRSDSAVTRDRMMVKAIRRSADELVGLAPLMCTQRPAVGPLRTNVIGFFGADQYVTEQRGPIVDPTCQAEVGAALADDLLADPTWDWINWDGLDPASGFATAIDRAMTLEWGKSQCGNILLLPSTWEALKKGLKRNIKEALRRCYNSPARDGHTLRLEVAKAPQAIGPAVALFLKLHAARSTQEGGAVHVNRLSSQTVQQFIHAVCNGLAIAGITRVFTLYAGDVPVASRVGFVLGDCLYLYYSGSDPQWGKYSVATTLVAEAIKYAIAQGLRSVHLSMGSDVSKARWDPKTPVFHEAVWVRPRARSRIPFEVYAWSRNQDGLAPIARRILRRPTH